MNEQRKTTPGTNRFRTRKPNRLRAMTAVMLRVDGFNDREIAEFLGMSRANVTQIRRHTDAPLRVGAILIALRNQTLTERGDA